METQTTDHVLVPHSGRGAVTAGAAEQAEGPRGPTASGGEVAESSTAHGDLLHLPGGAEGRGVASAPATSKEEAASGSGRLAF